MCDDYITGRNERALVGVEKSIGRLSITPMGAGGPAETRGVLGGNMPAPSTTTPKGRYGLALVGRPQLALSEGVKFSVRDIPGLESSRKDGVVAEISRSPTDAAILGLKNLSCRRWDVVLSGGRNIQVDPGQSLRLQAGAEIDFGNSVGRIC
jgi:hypothetical protein